VKGSMQRVRAVIDGDQPDRTPLYDLLRNDAVLSHFAGETLSLENAPEVVFRAYEPAVDATRPAVRLPGEEKTVTLPDGRKQRHLRWTVWTEPVRYPDPEAYARAKRDLLEQADFTWGPDQDRQIADFLADVDTHRHRLGEVYFLPAAGSVSLGGLYMEIGLEMFSYVLADYPDLINDLLEYQTRFIVGWIEHLPPDHGLHGVTVFDDIAYKTGPFLSPTWFERNYLPRLALVMDAYHARGIKVQFHSDGNLMPILDGLVDAGIDGLNPLEVLAGMDAGEIHRRHPHLFLTGGIDVSQLLPYGTPAQIRDAVHRAIDAAEGRIMIGSSTELNNEVPLRNYLALREAVLA